MSQASPRRSCLRFFSTVTLACFLLAFLSSCQLFGKREAHVQRYYDCFDTVSEITGFAESQGIFDSQVDAVYQEMKRYHSLFTDFPEGAAEGGIYALNQKAGQGPQKVDPLVFDLLDFAKAFCERSQGAINVAMGAVTKLWYEARERAQQGGQARLPKPEELEEARQHSDLSKLVLDRSSGTVELLDPKMRLDCGAIAKGYAVELLARSLESRGLKGWLLNIGGNVRSVGGKGAQGKPWRVGLRAAYLPTEPEQDREAQQAQEQRSVGVYDIENQSLVSSGVYERYFLSGGRCYHHIIDPKSLQPELNYLQVSVFGPDSGICDGLTTALFNLSEEEGHRLLKAYGSGYAAQWVYADGKTTETELMAQIREPEQAQQKN